MGGQSHGGMVTDTVPESNGMSHHQTVQTGGITVESILTDVTTLSPGSDRPADSVASEKLHTGPATVSITVGHSRLTVNLGHTQVTSAQLMAALEAAVDRLQVEPRQREAA